MESEDYGDSEPQAMCENTMGPRRRERKMIGFSRRLELQRLAVKIAQDVLNSTESHERCLLRSMVDDLVNER